MGAPSAIDSRRPAPSPGGRSIELLGLLATFGYLVFADPHDPGTPMPRCPIKLASGWDCPSCGGLRMVHDLMHGRFRQALVDNPFLVLVSPILLYLLYQRTRAVHRGQAFQIPTSVTYGLLIAASVWMVMRNLPSWPWKPYHLGAIRPE